MKNLFKTIVFCLIPIFILIAVNEFTRFQLKKDFSLKIHTENYSNNECSWACHFNTQHCKDNHLTILKNKTAFTDKIYFGTIELLNYFGDYKTSNIIIYVLIFPLVCFMLLLNLFRLKINKTKWNQ